MAAIARNMAVDYLRKAGKMTPSEDVEMLNSDAFTERTTAEDTTIQNMHMTHLLSFLAEDERSFFEAYSFPASLKLLSFTGYR